MGKSQIYTLTREDFAATLSLYIETLQNLQEKPCTTKSSFKVLLNQ